MVREVRMSPEVDMWYERHLPRELDGETKAILNEIENPRISKPGEQLLKYSEKVYAKSDDGKF